MIVKEGMHADTFGARPNMCPPRALLASFVRETTAANDATGVTEEVASAMARLADEVRSRDGNNAGTYLSHKEYTYMLRNRFSHVVGGVVFYRQVGAEARFRCDAMLADTTVWDESLPVLRIAWMGEAKSSTPSGRRGTTCA